MDNERLRNIVLKFAKTLFEGRITDAEKILASLKRRISTEEEKRAYLALYGLYFSYTSEDKDSLLFKLYTNGDAVTNSQKFLKVIKETSINVLGKQDAYIEVWKIILNNIDKIPVPHKLK